MVRFELRQEAQGKNSVSKEQTTAYVVKTRSSMVHHVLEGLRDVRVARDIGIES